MLSKRREGVIDRTVQNAIHDARYQSIGSEQKKLFESMIQQHRPRLLWLAYRIVQNQEEAEDVVQEALLRAFRKLSAFRGDSKVSTWLGVIVQNTALEWLRSRRNRCFVSLEACRKDEEGEVSFFNLADPHPDPEQLYERAEIQAILLDEVRQLSELCRTAIQLCSIEERPLCELASDSDASIVSVKSRIFRGKQLLRRSLCQRLGGVDRIAVP